CGARERALSAREGQGRARANRSFGRCGTRCAGSLSRRAGTFSAARRESRSGGGAFLVSFAGAGEPSDAAPLSSALKGSRSKGGTRPGALVAACPASRLRDAFGRRRRGSQERADLARSRRHLDNADLHPCRGGAPATHGGVGAPLGARQNENAKLRNVGG